MSQGRPAAPDTAPAGSVGPDSLESDRLRFLVRHLRVRLWETDAELRITYFEGGLPALDASAPDGAIGRSLLDLHAEGEHFGEETGQVARLRAREPFRGYEFAWPMPDGASIRLRVSGEPRFAADGAFLGYRGTIEDISREVRARAEGARAGAARERELLKEAIEVMEDAFAIYDPDDRLVVYNRPYRALYGESVRPGVTLRALYDEARRLGRVAHPSRTAYHWKRRRLAREPGRLPPLEQEMAGGRWIRVTTARMRDGGSVEIRTDITTLKLREQALQAIMDNVAEGIVLFRPDGRIVEANTAAARMFAREAGALVGRDVVELLAADGQNEAARMLRGRLADGENLDSQGLAVPATGRRADGTTFPVEISLAPATLGGAHTWIMAVHDVSGRAALESQLAHADRLRTMGEMAATLAHELKQPLSVISMAAENAAIRLESPDGAEPAYLAEKLDTITEQVEHVRRLIGHIRSYARRETEGDEPFDPATALEDALRMFAKEFEARGIALTVAARAGGAMVRGHPIRFGQAVVNLLSNARDAVAGRAAREPGAPRAVEVALDAVAGGVRISIADTGGGIPVEAMESIFEPFVTSKPSGEGTGLGLPIVRSIVAGMDGTIEVANEGEGCRFTITVPALSDAA